MLDYLIIGAGFAGSVIAERIANILGKKVLIIEKRNHAGGNCFDFQNSYGIITHKYGPHIFHTNYSDVFRYLSNFTDWNIYYHKVLVSVDGKKIPLPFNFNSIEQLFPQYLARRFEKKLLNKYKYGEKVPILEIKRENDADLVFLANFIYNKIFKNYTAKQWNTKPEYLDTQVTDRVPILIGKDNRYFNDVYQVIPSEGYSRIFERMLSHPNIKIMLNTDFKEVLHIDLESKKIYFLGKEFEGKVIFTGMIDDLLNHVLGILQYRSLDLRFENLDVDYFQKVATVNYPNEYDFTRITEFKHIHPCNSKKTVILKEYPKEYESGKDIPYYPMLDRRNIEVYNKYKEISDTFSNLLLVGRLAEYKYYDMDDIIKKALDTFEQKVLNI